MSSNVNMVFICLGIIFIGYFTYIKYPSEEDDFRSQVRLMAFIIAGVFGCAYSEFGLWIKYVKANDSLANCRELSDLGITIDCSGVIYSIINFISIILLFISFVLVYKINNSKAEWYGTKRYFSGILFFFATWILPQLVIIVCCIVLLIVFILERKYQDDKSEIRKVLKSIIGSAVKLYLISLIFTKIIEKVNRFDMIYGLCAFILAMIFIYFNLMGDHHIIEYIIEGEEK